MSTRTRQTVLLALLGTPAFAQPPGTLESSDDFRSCDTLYIGLPGSDWRNPDNWTVGIPGRKEKACFVDHASRSTSKASQSFIPASQLLIQPAYTSLTRIVAGVPAGAGSSTLVYQNEIEPVAAIRVPGAWDLMADDLILSSGSTYVTSYEIAVFGQGITGNSTFDAFTSLWDGDPCDPRSMMIPGTAGDFFNIANDGSTVWFLEYVFSEPIRVPANVWLSVYFSTDDAGWAVAEQAELGFTFNHWSEDDAALGCRLLVFSDDLYAGFWASVSAQPGYNPIGACCAGPVCVITDQFDCKIIRQGYFREGVVGCFPDTCTPGACCNPSHVCFDSTSGIGTIDEPACAAMDGNYLGGAACDDADLCERYRLPLGYETIELTPGMEALKRRHPRMNNCGEVVVQIGTPQTEWEADIFLFDNGTMTPLSGL